MADEQYFALGTMSGTSADGIDVALIRSDGESGFEFIGALTRSYESAFQSALLNAATNDVPVDKLLQLERQLTLQHVDACGELLADAGVEAEDVGLLGFHGHTIRHDPGAGLTLQIGDAALLASRTGIPVVHDFRRADIAAGGQGAPLVPLFHRMLFADQTEAHDKISVLNLGGVANLTCLSRDGGIRASDTGPGCGLLDQWVQRHLGQPFDEGGRLALQGTIVQSVVDTALADRFFSLPPPRSADRHQFAVPGIESLSPADGAATLCAITVGAIRDCLIAMEFEPNALYVCGGGAKNLVLMEMLRAEFERIFEAERVGLRGDSLEAECFAWLAIRRFRGLATSLPETTGCERPVVGGSLTGQRRLA